MGTCGTRQRRLLGWSCDLLKEEFEYHRIRRKLFQNLDMQRPSFTEVFEKKLALESGVRKNQESGKVRYLTLGGRQGRGRQSIGVLALSFAAVQKQTITR